jgi:Flp pilus assembly protein TadD
MNDDTTAAYLAGIKAFGAQRHEEALGHYDRALAGEPDCTEVLSATAIALMHLGRLEEAIATARRVSELDPEDPMVHTSLSMFLQRQGKIEEAEKEAAQHRLKSWRQELKRNPKAPPPTDAGGFHVIQ